MSHQQVSICVCVVFLDFLELETQKILQLF